MKTGDMSEIKRSKTNICNYIQAKPLKHAYLASIQPGSLERLWVSLDEHLLSEEICPKFSLVQLPGGYKSALLYLQ